MELDQQTLTTLEGLIAEGVAFGVDILGALTILVVGWIIVGWIQRRVTVFLGRSKVDQTLQPIIASVVRYILMIFILIAVLAQFGVQTASIIAALGAAGLAIGLALQGTLQNIAAGFMLLFLRPFKVGDYIDAEGRTGTVDEIGLFVTQMTTLEGVFVSVPNSQLWGSMIHNYSRLPNRRVDVVVGIAYGDDIESGQAALMALMGSDPRILGDPASQVLVKELADSSVNLNLRCWCKTEDYWDVLFDLTKAAKLEIDAAGLTIPFPQRDVHLMQAAQ
jgi:small conductance mechanosensitive channel